jgi:hypothetical protein
MACGAFAYDGTGPVNGEALMIATGQNLKRLLKKRGWGRRPFPAEGAALVPRAYEEKEAFPRSMALKSQKTRVAIASLVSVGIIGVLFVAQMSLFSPGTALRLMALSFALSGFSFLFLIFPFQENLCTVKLMCFL